MSKDYQHVCIKPGCSNVYNDGDPDAYYCEGCKEALKSTAKTVDATARPPKHVPNFEERMGQFKTVKGITHINLPNNG